MRKQTTIVVIGALRVNIHFLSSKYLTFLAVDIVMRKRPIKMLDVQLNIQIYAPLLDETETIDRVDIRGLPTDLANGVKTNYLEGIIHPSITLGTGGEDKLVEILSPISLV